MAPPPGTQVRAGGCRHSGCRYGPWLRGVGPLWAGAVEPWAAEFTAPAAVVAAALATLVAAVAAAIPAGPPAAPPAISPMDRAERITPPGSDIPK